MIYDLDRDESIDIVKVNGKSYRVWDVPVAVKVLFMNTRYNFWDVIKWVKRIDKWRNVVKEYLKVFNDNVDISKWDDGQVFQLLNILKIKILGWEK